MPQISVITSTFNRADRLKQNIESVRKQSFTDYEHIIIDDCSTDNTKKVLEKYAAKDPRIKPIFREKNFGHDGRPKNEGIKAAQGEYITILDDDDVYRPDALKVLYNYAQNTHADVVYCDYLIEGRPGWSLDFSPRRLNHHNYISMCVIIAKRKKVVEVGGFDEDVPKFKDWNLWLRMQKNGCTFVHIPIIITDVRQDDDSMSLRVKSDMDETGRYLPTYFNPADCKIFPDNTVLGERKPLKVAVYTLTMDRVEYTKKMYQALKKTAGYPFDWFVIDQGSKDTTVDFLKGLGKEVNATFLEKNIGLAAGWNMALDKVKDYDIAVKVDNDAELMTDNWLKDMVDIFERNMKVILSPYVEGLEHSPGGVLRQRSDGEMPYMLINQRVLGMVPNLGGIVFAAPGKIFNTFRFDPDLKGNKDYYLSQYAKSLGYSLFYMEEYRVWHIDGTLGQRQKYPEYFKENYG